MFLLASISLFEAGESIVKGVKQNMFGDFNKTLFTKKLIEFKDLAEPQRPHEWSFLKLLDRSYTTVIKFSDRLILCPEQSKWWMHFVFGEIDKVVNNFQLAAMILFF